MAHPFEDSPPNVPARSYGSRVIDDMSTLCMAARQARARLAIKTIGSCKCGRPVYRNGQCAGCAEVSR